MFRILWVLLLSLIFMVSICQAVETPYRLTWWCGAAYAERPDEASINVNFREEPYPSSVVLPEVHAYSACNFLTTTGTPNAPGIKDLSSARFVWTSSSGGGFVTKGARIFLGAGAKLPSSGLASFDTINVYARLKVNETDRLDEIHFAYQTENDTLSDGGDVLAGSGLADDTYKTFSDTFTGKDLSGDESIWLSLNVSGTDTSGNVGLTILDVEYIAIEVLDT